MRSSRRNLGLQPELIPSDSESEMADTDGENVQDLESVAEINTEIGRNLSSESEDVILGGEELEEDNDSSEDSSFDANVVDNATSKCHYLGNAI